MRTNEPKRMLESQLAKGLALSESWSNKNPTGIKGYEGCDAVDFLKGLESDYEKASMAQMFENTMHWLGTLDEATRTLQVGSFEKFVFPLLRAVQANLIAPDIVTVSPLDAPTGLVFYFDVTYGSTKGNIPQGAKMFDVRRGPAQAYHYTDEIVEEENLGTGDGATDRFGNGTAAFAYTPIRSGTVVITDGTQEVRDNGNGQLVGDVNAGGVNTINYVTGVYDVTFAAAPGNGDSVTTTYEYNSEANAGTPEIDLQLTSAPVTARTNKLRARWSLEAQQDFQAYHGISAEVELVAFMGNEIARELDYKIINHIRQVASAGSVTWDRTPPAGVPWIWHKESFYDVCIEQSNLIYSRTQRASGNWIVASVDVCNVIETLSKFKPTGGRAKAEGLAGVRYIGDLGEFAIYKHPAYTTSEFLMGHKGTSFLDTGYIYAPYLQLFTTGTITLDDMISRKGMGHRSGLKVVNSGMYATGSVTQSGAAF